MTRFIQAEWAAAAFAGSLCLLAGAAQAQGKSKMAHPEHGHPAKEANNPQPAGEPDKPDGRPSPAMHAAAPGSAAERMEKHAAAPGSDLPRGREGAAERAAKDSAEPGSDSDAPASARAAWTEALEHARSVAKHERANKKPNAKAKQKAGAEPEADEAVQADSARERAQKHRQALQQRFAAIGKDKREPLTQELRHHAHRTAKLARIRAIAESKGDKQTLARVDRLAERELARHDAKLARLGASANNQAADKDRQPPSAAVEKAPAPAAAAKENAP